MMDRLQQNHAKMSRLLEGLAPLKADYTMDELCYLLMDHCEGLIGKTEELSRFQDQEYLTTVNLRLKEEIKALRAQIQKKEADKIRAGATH